MKHLKNYIQFSESLNSRIGRTNFTNRKDKSIRQYIELYQMADKIFAVKIKDDILRTYLFMRYAEFYESPNEEMRDIEIEIDKYIKWYKEYTKQELFTYSNDWAGFNIPSYSILKCLSKINDPNEYDSIMNSIVDTIKEKVGDNFYLLGVDDVDSVLLEHEMAHGLYYTSIDYKNKMDSITKSLPKEIFNELKDIILSVGYTDFVINDEIQAYVSTGLHSSMEKIKDIDLYIEKYKEVFYSTLEKKDPVKIEIKYND